MAVSNDPAEALYSWAKDADFPVLFGSDPEGAAPAAFGVGARGNGMPQSRAVVVVDPEGRVAWATSVFREIDPTAYEELGEAVAEVAPPLDSDEAEEDDAQAAAFTTPQGTGVTAGC